MSWIAFIILSLTIALPIAWFVSEFSAPRWLRIVLGTLAVLMSFGVAFIVGSLERMNSNAWFGGATKDLIDTTVTELDAGRQESVVQALKQFQSEYQPTYENRARYDELVRETVERMQLASAAPATRPAADLEADLKRLRGHDPKELASPAAMESARRVFDGLGFVGLTGDEVRKRLGAAHSEERIAGRPVWQYSYHDGEQGVVRNMWFDFDGRAVWGVEPIRTE